MSPIPCPSKDSEQGSKHDESLSQEALKAIYGNVEDKKKAYEESLKRWWSEYADRKNHEDDEYVANSLLYDRNHLPRTAPAPDCVRTSGQQQQQEEDCAKH
ncbi:hypothetical protein M9435_003333 [Picochlorum sp. BPE23]|nr:hypothetical protein M9435_003333 [Picochlorum sp. BPE23]